MTPIVVALVSIAAVMHALWNFATKREAGSLSLLWIGNCLAALCVLPFAAFFALHTPFNIASIPYLLATSVIHVFYFINLAKSYQHGDISLVYPISRGIGVAGTVLFGCFLLGERLTITGLSGIILICLGIILIGMRRVMDPGRDRKAFYYCILVGSAVASYSVVDKVGVSFINPVVYIFAQTLLAALFLAPYVLGKLRAEAIVTWRTRKKLGLAVGLCSIGTYVLILFAFRLGQVSYIVPMREFSVVIGSVLGIIILRERLTARKGLGILLVVAGLVAIGLA